MPKKNMSPDERKAWGQKMKAAREAKKGIKGVDYFESAPPVPEDGLSTNP